MADTLISGTTLVEKESRSIGDVPIGGIVAWVKSLSGVPNLAEGWVECDGAVLVDALSPLNGVTIPDLNGNNQFMRGNSTSGGTGGSETSNLAHTHELPFFDDGTALHFTAGGEFGVGNSFTSDKKITYGAGSDESGAWKSKTALSSSTENKPPFYNVVWIMRVR